MPREIVGKGLRFSLRHAPCAHICRYCLISESRKRSALPFARFEQLVHRFHDWRQTERPDLEIGVFVGPSYDYDIETLKGIARLRERRGAKFRILNLGGLRMRRGEELTAWLQERRAAGIVGLHASLAGCGEMHDRWNGRRGDFDYQIEILRLGSAHGMGREEKLFLTRNTLPVFGRLLEILDAIPGELRSRSASPFFYAGLAARYEDERLTEDDRDRLPNWINALRPRKFGTWLSEREWIPVMLETAPQPRRLLLKLDVDEANIDYLEQASCEQIFLSREREYQESYREIPALDELCSRYGDPTNRRIYMMSRDVEGRWLDLHQRETGASKPID
ncbi:MAG TPA: radical SAM protein [Acetobacteraceae bacterium]|nr:radical SAM protein [Acetobacteraceae bacterium]